MGRESACVILQFGPRGCEPAHVVTCAFNAHGLIRLSLKRTPKVWLRLFLAGESIELSGIYNSSNGCNQTGSGRRLLLGGLQLAFILEENNRPYRL